MRPSGELQFLWHCSAQETILSVSMTPFKIQASQCSCLYECRVMHERFIPRHNRFSYGAFWFYLNLDEIPALSQRQHLFGLCSPHPYQFRQSDHLNIDSPAPGGLKERVRYWLGTQGVETEDTDSIWLLTLPRVFGYVFNPVSFYFVFKADGTPVVAIAEVGNTYGEQKPYLVPIVPDPNGPKTNRFRTVVPKLFYVSPFSPLEWHFDFRLRTPGTHLAISVDDVHGQKQTALATRLTGVRRPLTDWNLFRLSFRYPLVTLRVIFLIHWQAFRLWTKRVPWFRKTAQPHQQQGVLRPHKSILNRLPVSESFPLKPS